MKFRPLYSTKGVEPNDVSIPSLISYSMIVLYSRDDDGLGVAFHTVSLKNPPQFTFTTTQPYWLSKIKPKTVFRLI